VIDVRRDAGLSVRRLSRVIEEPVSTVGRWIRPVSLPAALRHRKPDEESLREKIRALCLEPRNRTFGHRRIRALLKRVYGLKVNRKRVLRVMKELGLTQSRIRHREARPKRVEKMRPTGPNQAWQIDMTSFALSDMSPLFLIVIIDCFTRQVVGWNLDRRCRASEWVSAVRTALEARGLLAKEACEGLVLRSDNGCQPCSKEFRAYLSKTGVSPQYTGYDAPDDNAFVERVIRTIKEEEIWPSSYDSLAEALKSLEDYISYYNASRIHASLGYRTPDEAFAAALVTLAAA
jgi:putative transposase